MNNRIAKLALIAVILVVSVSGCASLSLQPTANTKLPVNSGSDSLDMKFGMARLLERNGKLEAARKAYLEILSAEPHTPSLHRLGVTAIRQNRLDGGLKYLYEAINAEDPTPELLGDYGYALLLAGELPAAESTLKEAVSLEPSNKRNVNNLAIVIGKQDRLSESFQLFRQASPEAEALANLAFIQAQSDELDNAKLNYNRALDVDPELRIAALGLMEVHKNIQANHEVIEAVEPRIQPTRPQQRIVRNQPAPNSRTNPVANTRATQAESAQVTDRVLASMRRQVQLPGRMPSSTARQNEPKARKAPTQRVAKRAAPKPAKASAKNMASGKFQPPSFSTHRSTGNIAQVSYEETVVAQPPPQSSRSNR